MANAKQPDADAILRASDSESISVSVSVGEGCGEGAGLFDGPVPALDPPEPNGCVLWREATAQWPPRSRAAQARVIYAAYPRHEEPEDAIRAIEDVLRREPFADVLDATLAFRASSKGRGPYVRHPARWFRKGGHRGDREAWKAGNAGTDKQRPSVAKGLDAIAKSKERYGARRPGA